LFDLNSTVSLYPFAIAASSNCFCSWADKGFCVPLVLSVTKILVPPRCHFPTIDWASHLQKPANPRVMKVITIITFNVKAVKVDLVFILLF